MTIIISNKTPKANKDISILGGSHMDIMISAKALSTNTDGAIYQIGAVTFDPTVLGRYGAGFSRYIQIESHTGCIDSDVLIHMLEDRNTNRLSTSLRTRSVSLRTALKDLVNLADIEKFNWSTVMVWTWHPYADLSILRSAYERVDLPPPWDKTQEAYARLLCMSVNVPKEVYGHSIDQALKESLARARAVQKANQDGCSNLRKGIRNITSFHSNRLVVR